MDSNGRSVNAFHRVPGEGWKIVYEGRSVRLPELKGLHYIACLLGRPGEPVHVSELSRGLSRGGPSRGRVPPPVPDDVERTRKAVSNRIRETIGRISACDENLGVHLDRAIRTGTRCSYAPGRTVPWRL